tara:strand:- start:380 stop:805 length:426 start_codon:yes stop_codon:yes gene_type:complete
MSFNPEQWAEDQMTDIGLDVATYGEYIDPYDFLNEQFHQMEYSQGITTLQNEFAQQSTTLEQNIGSLGFEDSYMERDLKDALSIDFYSKSDDLAFDLGKDILKERKDWEEQFWATITNIASSDAYYTALDDDDIAEEVTDG